MCFLNFVNHQYLERFHVFSVDLHGVLHGLSTVRSVAVLQSQLKNAAQRMLQREVTDSFPIKIMRDRATVDSGPSVKCSTSTLPDAQSASVY